MSTPAIREIRAMRAVAPALVDVERRDTYSAALEQFEQLIGAAGAVSYAARPMLLFYATSQASRALAASRVISNWELRGHGLGWAAPMPPDLMSRAVRRKAAKPRDGFQDAFSGLCRAINTPVPTEAMPLGALLAALPEIDLPFNGQLVAAWPRPLGVVFEIEIDDRPLHASLKGSLTGYILGAQAQTPEELMTELAKYSAANGAQVDSYEHQGIEGLVTRPVGDESAPTVIWPLPHRGQPASFMDIAAPRYWTGQRLLLPDVGRAGGLPPLAMWTSLLYALSMMARYEPGVWRRALDTDRSKVAAALESTLDSALTAVPKHVLSALQRSPLDVLAHRDPRRRVVDHPSRLADGLILASTVILRCSAAEHRVGPNTNSAKDGCV